MATNKTHLDVYIDGKLANPHLEWQDLTVISTFDNNAVQANITMGKITFVLDNATYLRSKINDIFFGIPIRMQLSNQSLSKVGFDGFINLSDDCDIDEVNNRVTATIMLGNGLFTLQERLSAISFGYLYDKGFVKNTDFRDFKYSVIKIDPTAELALLSFATFSILVNLYLSIKEFSKDVTKLSIDLANPLTTANAIAYGIALVIIDAAFVVTYAIFSFEFGKNLINLIYPFERNGKCMSLRKGIDAVCSYLGLTLKTDLVILDEIYFIPSNSNFDTIDPFGVITKWNGPDKGIPQIYDPCYYCYQWFEEAIKVTNGRMSLMNNGKELWIYNVNNPLWFEKSNWKMPNVLNKIKKFNTNEMKANTLISFNTDSSGDSWTVKEYNGTSYEVIIRPINNIPFANNYVFGLREVRFPFALAKQKTELSPLENSLKNVLSTLDSLNNFFFIDSDLASEITDKLNTIKVDTNKWAVSKLVRFDSNMKVVTSDKWSAKFIYENFYATDSFVSNNFYGQKIVYNKVKVPFGLKDFVYLQNNSYFITDDGSQGKVESLNWSMDKDYAEISYWIRKPYTKTLKEEYYEP